MTSRQVILQEILHYLTQQLCSFFRVLRVHGVRQEGVQAGGRLLFTSLLVLGLQFQMNR